MDFLWNIYVTKEIVKNLTDVIVSYFYSGYGSELARKFRIHNIVFVQLHILKEVQCVANNIHNFYIHNFYIRYILNKA